MACSRRAGIPAALAMTAAPCPRDHGGLFRIRGSLPPPRPSPGRAAHPVFNHYRPTLRIDASYVNGTITFPEGTEMVMPGGDWTEVTIQLAQATPMEASMHFSIHEGDRTVGTGQVTKIIR